MIDNIRFYPGKKMMQLKQYMMQYCDTLKKRHKSSLVLNFWPRLYMCYENFFEIILTCLGLLYIKIENLFKFSFIKC